MATEYLTLRQLSARCGLSVSTLKRHLASPDRALPFYKPGGRVLVKWEDFERWMEHWRQVESAAGAMTREALRRA